MKLNRENIVSSTDYFKLSKAELLEVRNEYDYTREECKLFDDGLNVTFFDSKDEMMEESEEFLNWLEDKKLELKAIIRTVNGRIAVVSI